MIVVKFKVNEWLGICWRFSVVWWSRWWKVRVGSPCIDDHKWWLWPNRVFVISLARFSWIGLEHFQVGHSYTQWKSLCLIWNIRIQLHSILSRPIEWNDPSSLRRQDYCSCNAEPHRTTCGQLVHSSRNQCSWPNFLLACHVNCEENASSFLDEPWSLPIFSQNPWTLDQASMVGHHALPYIDCGPRCTRFGRHRSCNLDSDQPPCPTTRWATRGWPG